MNAAYLVAVVASVLPVACQPVPNTETVSAETAVPTPDMALVDEPAIPTEMQLKLPPRVSLEAPKIEDEPSEADEQRTRTELEALLERAGLEPWEHPELTRALDNPDDLPLSDLLRRRAEIMRSIPQHVPADEGYISSTFGKRMVPGKRLPTDHKGLDIAAPEGTIVYAPADGVVRFAGKFGGFGNYLSIVHGYGIVTKYAHNTALLVRKGERVRAGDPIAKIGQTGRARGLHLHYEVWVNDHAADPLGFMPPVPGLSDGIAAQPQSDGTPL